MKNFLEVDFHHISQNSQTVSLVDLHLMDKGSFVHENFLKLF